ncbi:MAG: glycosyltransferase [Planctomycetota bacterium]
MPIPILIIGDAPNLPTGLARIARDVAYCLWGERANLDIEVSQLAHGWDGSPWPWKVFPLFDAENWGKKDIDRTLDWIGAPPRVIFSFWDPSRCLSASRASIKTRKWGYFAIDGDNSDFKIGGPALRAVREYDRVLAYGNYGSRVLANSLERDSVQWLPHGFFPQPMSEDLRPQDVVLGWPEDATVIGCVASNQARKDLGLLFATLDRYKWEGNPVTLWLHIDRVIDRAWSVPELAKIYNRNDETLIVTTSLQDVELWTLYRACTATIAPGLGEGFGYPIVESLACGTPVIHVDYAGGAELIPNDRWLFPAQMFRVDGPYAIRRPLIDEREVKASLHNVLSRMRDEEEVTRAYCRGAVANLEWSALWPRWRSWVIQGLNEIRENG